MTDCTICYDSLGRVPIKLPCGHLFHEECLILWVYTNKSCPLCRRNVDVKTIYGNKALFFLLKKLFSILMTIVFFSLHISLDIYRFLFLFRALDISKLLVLGVCFYIIPRISDQYTNYKYLTSYLSWIVICIAGDPTIIMSRYFYSVVLRDQISYIIKVLLYRFYSRDRCADDIKNLSKTVNVRFKVASFAIVVLTILNACLGFWTIVIKIVHHAVMSNVTQLGRELMN